MKNQMTHRKGKMSSAERLELARVVRMRGKVAKQDLDVRAAQQLALVEQQLAARYSESHQLWAEVTMQAREVVEEADAKIAEICKAIGVLPSFRPHLEAYWSGRGENADQNRRQELRLMAESRIEAIKEKAKLQISRNEAEVLTQLAADGFTTEAAKQMLVSLPTAEQLLPELQLIELEKLRPVPELTENVEDY